MTGRGYPVPPQRPPRPVARYPQERDAHARYPQERDIHTPRHLADAWEGPVNRNRTLPSRRHGLQWLLAIPLIPPLLVPLYNRLEPRLMGIPFFYWYQLACAAFATDRVSGAAAGDDAA